MTLDEAEELAKQSTYGQEAVEQEGECECGRRLVNSINWADAGAFFLEGYLYAIRSAQHR